MARKIQISTYLPEDIIDKIDVYKEEHKLKSRSLAIERIILEWDFINRSGSSINQPKQEKKEAKTREELQNELMDIGFDEIFDNM